MGTLGFEVERQSNTASTRPAGSRRYRNERVPVPERGGKVRRRLSDATAAVQVGVPFAQASCPRQEQQGHEYVVFNDSRMADNRVRRPYNANLLRPSSRNRGRPASASSAQCGDNTNRAYNSGNRDMDVLLEICRDQGRAASLDPADFDSRYRKSHYARTTWVLSE